MTSRLIRCQCQTRKTKSPKNKLVNYAPGLSVALFSYVVISLVLVPPPMECLFYWETSAAPFMCLVLPESVGRLGRYRIVALLV